MPKVYTGQGCSELKPLLVPLPPSPPILAVAGENEIMLPPGLLCIILSHYNKVVLPGLGAGEGGRGQNHNFCVNPGFSLWFLAEKKRGFRTANERGATVSSLNKK